jgi:hypothetical protein
MRATHAPADSGALRCAPSLLSRARAHSPLPLPSRALALAPALFRARFLARFLPRSLRRHLLLADKSDISAPPADADASASASALSPSGCFRNDPAAALAVAFAKTETDLARYYAKSRDPAGTCAVVALLRGGVVWVANAGDSRAQIVTVDGGDGARARGRALPFPAPPSRPRPRCRPLSSSLPPLLLRRARTPHALARARAVASAPERASLTRSVAPASPRARALPPLSPRGCVGGPRPSPAAPPPLRAPLRHQSALSCSQSSTEPPHPPSASASRRRAASYAASRRPLPSAAAVRPSCARTRRAPSLAPRARGFEPAADSAAHPDPHTTRARRARACVPSLPPLPSRRARPCRSRTTARWAT